VPAGPAPDLAHEAHVAGVQLNEAVPLAAVPPNLAVRGEPADQDGQVVLVVEVVAQDVAGHLTRLPQESNVCSDGI